MKNLLSISIAAFLCFQANSFAKNLPADLISKNIRTGRHVVAHKSKSHGEGWCDIYYSTDTSTGSATEIKIMSGSTVIADYFPGGVMSTYLGSIPQGTYSVIVTTSGTSYNSSTHSGFDSFYFYGDYTPVQCYEHSGSYSLTVDASNSSYVNFNIDYGQCS